jgi:hypothetical protein
MGFDPSLADGCMWNVTPASDAAVVTTCRLEILGDVCLGPTETTCRFLQITSNQSSVKLTWRRSS